MGTLSIPLGSRKYPGFVAVIDEQDADLILPIHWSLFVNRDNHRTRYYAQGTVCGRMVLMHRFILGASTGTRVDHQDGDGLNNRRSNLRLATALENTVNRPKQSHSQSPFKGVKHSKKRWVACIRKDGVTYRLGIFDDPALAAVAYDEAARRLFGAFACVNFPREGERGALAR